MSNCPTQIIPTDRHGNVYYGPRTLRQCEVIIEATSLDYQEIRGMVQQLREAGYTGVAARLAKRYRI